MLNHQVFLVISISNTGRRFSCEFFCLLYSDFLQVKRTVEFNDLSEMRDSLRDLGIKRKEGDGF